STASTPTSTPRSTTPAGARPASAASARSASARPCPSTATAIRSPPSTPARTCGGTFEPHRLPPAPEGPVKAPDFLRSVGLLNSLVPAGLLAFYAATARLGANPVDFFLRATGTAALCFLLASL